MESIKYITDSKGRHSGLVLDLNIIRKTLRKKKDLVELMEDIEDIVSVELSKDEKSVSYEEARKRIFRKKK
ncbi:MAG: hypothetical protein JWO06_3870 [Bacteroidota bacterium]|nr:hypothetical protein [Bacteroidota bacterium]